MSGPPSAALLLYQTVFFDRVLPEIAHVFWVAFDQSKCNDMKYVQDRSYQMTNDTEAFEAFYGKMRDFPDSTKYIMKNWVYTMRRESGVNVRYSDPRNEQSDVSCENRRFWTNFWKAMASKIFTMPSVCMDPRLRLVVAQQSIITAVCETALIIDENGNLPLELMPPSEDAAASSAPPSSSYYGSSRPPVYGQQQPPPQGYAPPRQQPPGGAYAQYTQQQSSSYSGGGRTKSFVVPTK